MKLKINDKYQDVSFWSFMKCSVLTQLAMAGLFYVGAIVLGVIFSLAFIRSYYLI